MINESVNEAQETTGAADDTDALLAEVYKAESPTPISEKPAPTPTPESPRLWKIKRGDMEVEKPENEVIALAQKGFDYEMNNRLLRTERELLETQKQKYKPFESINPERFKTLADLDEFAEKNPKFLELVKTEWQKFTSGQTSEGSPSTGDFIKSPFFEKLNSLEKTVSELQNEKQAQLTKQEDRRLDEGLKELRSKYGDMAWDRADDNGFTLEHQLLQHMSSYGFPTAKAAFMDLFGDKLLQMTAEKVKEQTAKEIQDRHKKGFLINNKLNAPSSFQSPSRSVGNASYDDIAASVIKELNLG